MAAMVASPMLPSAPAQLAMEASGRVKQSDLKRSREAVCHLRSAGGGGGTAKRHEREQPRSQQRQRLRALHSQSCARARWLQFSHGSYSVWEIVNLLQSLPSVEGSRYTGIGSSRAAPGPLFQTAQRLRAKWPQHDWLHLVGLLHDLGAVMAVWGEPQPEGEENSFLVEVASSEQEKGSSLLHERCEEGGVTISWSPHEYLYHVLKHNNCKIPPEGLAIIRFCTFQAWHTQGQYKGLMGEGEEGLLRWVREFNKLHAPPTPVHAVADVDEMWCYYNSLIHKYCPGKLEW